MFTCRSLVGHPKTEGRKGRSQELLVLPVLLWQPLGKLQDCNQAPDPAVLMCCRRALLLAPLGSLPSLLHWAAASRGSGTSGDS